MKQREYDQNTRKSRVIYVNIFEEWVEKGDNAFLGYISTNITTLFRMLKILYIGIYLYCLQEFESKQYKHKGAT